MRFVLRIFKVKWLLTTFLVVAAALVMIRLGFWQLDRLEKRRAFNSRVLTQTNQPPLDLTKAVRSGNLFSSGELTEMEYREVLVKGVYDFEHEVALRNQAYLNQYGVHLLTPLKIDGSETWILVDRGWIPGTDFEAGKEDGNWNQYAEKGIVEVSGILRASQDKPDFGRIKDPVPTPGGERVTAWNLANLTQIQKQVPYPILPVYIMQSPDPAWTDLPYRGELDLEITEGPHLGYAIQWFTFASILLLGYPVFLYREENRDKVKNLIDRGQVFSGDQLNG